MISTSLHGVTYNMTIRKAQQFVSASPLLEA